MFNSIGAVIPGLPGNPSVQLDPVTGLPLHFNYPYNYPYLHPYAYIPPANYPFSVNMNVWEQIPALK